MDEVLNLWRAAEAALGDRVAELKRVDGSPGRLRVPHFAVCDDFLPVDVSPLLRDVVHRSIDLIERKDAHRLEVHFLVPIADILDATMNGRVEVDVDGIS